jgi:hypothetical protein
MAAQEQANPDALSIDDLNKRIDGYMKLRATVKGGLPKLKPTDSPAVISDYQRQLAHKIREARAQANQGDIFAPEIAAYFRKRIALTMQGRQAARIRKSLAHAEPVKLPVHVNEVYPASVPLQSTPPTLLLNLPKLPPELDYRVVGHSLVLRDVEANLVVDFMSKAIS